ncbi:MAG: DinB family protein [Acidobacteria bacterium]|nr:DinB family protein [Acidobacteriota bacterium]
MVLKDSLLADFDHEMGATRRLLERVPDDKLSWKPHVKSMTLGALAMHLCSLPQWGTTILNDACFDLLTAPPTREDATTRAGILAAFDDTVKKTRAAMDKTDAELLSFWTLTRGDQEMFTLPRIAAVRSFMLHHIIHHRGQLSVYLRLNDIPVPAIYGPTADEG